MNTNLIIIDEKSIKDKMYYIRGKMVMIDSDLAEIYGYSTKDFNRQVKNNIERFDEDFRFELTKEEVLYLSRCKNFTAMQTKGIKGGRVYNPYAFTEEGIYMLMTVLKGEKAIKQSKALIRIFKSMKDFLIENKILEQDYIKNMLLKHDNRIDKLELSMEKIILKKKENEIYFNGQVYDAYSRIIDILNESKKEVIIIDSYADKKILDIIKEMDRQIIIITKENNLLKKEVIEKYNKQYKNLKVYFDNTFHDRFIIIDKEIYYHLGTSINHLGEKTFVINIILEESFKKQLINKIKDLI